MSIADRIAVMDHARIEQSADRASSTTGRPRRSWRPSSGRSAGSATGTCARTTSRSASTGRRRSGGDGRAGPPPRLRGARRAHARRRRPVSAQLTRHAVDELELPEGDIVWLRALTTSGLAAQHDPVDPLRPAARQHDLGERGVAAGAGVRAVVGGRLAAPGVVASSPRAASANGRPRCVATCANWLDSSPMRSSSSRSPTGGGPTTNTPWPRGLREVDEPVEGPDGPPGRDAQAVVLRRSCRWRRSRGRRRSGRRRCASAPPSRPRSAPPRRPTCRRACRGCRR